jgi:hypothetical protein
MIRNCIRNTYSKVHPNLNRNLTHIRDRDCAEIMSNLQIATVTNDTSVYRLDIDWRIWFSHIQEIKTLYRQDIRKQFPNHNVIFPTRLTIGRVDRRDNAQHYVSYGLDTDGNIRFY